jgi:hypothetical protein
LVGGYFAWNWINPAEVPEQEQEEEMSFKVVAEDEFDIEVPSTWYRFTPPEGLKLYLADQGEETIDPATEKDGFKSYLAVTYDVRGEKTLSEFVEYVKGVLAEQIADITFAENKLMVIEGRSAIALEASITQEGYNFKTLLVVVEGEGEDIWTMSLNTSEARWEQIKDTFYQIAESFKLKINEETVQE